MESLEVLCLFCVLIGQGLCLIQVVLFFLQRVFIVLLGFGYVVLLLDFLLPASWFCWLKLLRPCVTRWKEQRGIWVGLLTLLFLWKLFQISFGINHTSFLNQVLVLILHLSFFRFTWKVMNIEYFKSFADLTNDLFISILFLFELCSF